MVIHMFTCYYSNKNSVDKYYIIISTVDEKTITNKINEPKTVLVGFIATWFLAASPIKRSVSVKPT